jgi:hypothetical protein
VAAKFPRMDTSASRSGDEYTGRSSTQVPCGKTISEEANGRTAVIAKALAERLAKAAASQHIKSHDCK